MSLDQLLWGIVLLAQATLLTLLGVRCIWKSFPFFCLLPTWFFIDDVFAYFASHSLPTFFYFRFYLFSLIVSAILEFLVLYELGVSIFRPFRAVLSARVSWIIGGGIFCLGAMIWPFAVAPGYGGLPSSWHFLVHLEQTEAILRILIFLLIAAGSRFLGISSRSRELQIAVGLGFYSMVGIVMALIRSHKSVNGFYGLASQIETMGYILSLLYWTISFARKEEAQKTVSPQMENLLRTIAGKAREGRESAIQSVQRKNE